MTTNLNKNEIVAVALEIFIKVGLLSIILYYSFAVLKPFITLTLWGIIIAVALFPLIKSIEKKLNNKRTLVVSLFALLTISALLIPTYLLSDSIIHSSTTLAHQFKEGKLAIPVVSEDVKEWPILGNKIYDIWDSANHNFKQTLIAFKPQLAAAASKIASFFGGALSAILQSVASIIIAALFLAKAEKSAQMYKKISIRIFGEQGENFADLSALTIRSVAQGVLGIAFVQSVFAFVGMQFMDVPLAWLWALLVMFLTIIQLPALIILGPVIAYVFSYADTTSATIFAVYAVIVGASDGLLKPIFLGRGLDIPMLVILLGAIGGMILSGLLGLFVGAVGLALAYKLFVTWLNEEELVTENA
jgi:predicted PurR-regulated permease PerM